MADILYAGAGGPSTTSDLYTEDPSTAASTSVGASGFGLTGIAYDPVGDVLYGATNTNSSVHPNSLVSLNTSTGAGTFIGAFGVVLADISVDSAGTMFGYCPTNNSLYSVNKGTGVATLVGSSGLSGTFGNGLAFDTSDVLYLFPKGAKSNYYTVNTSTGAASSAGVLTGVGLTLAIPAAGFDSGNVCYLIYQLGPTAQRATVNIGTGAITTIGATGITNVDALGWKNAAACPPPPDDSYPVDLTAYESSPYYLNFGSFRSGGCQDFTTLCATAQAGEPDPYPGFPASHSVWVTWDAFFTGAVTAWVESTDPNMADGVMSSYLWVAGPVSGLGAPLAQGDDDIGTEPEISFAVTNGDRIIFQVDTRDSGGAFTFRWKRSDGTPPANDDFANAQVLATDCGDVAGTFATATAQCDEPPRDGTGNGPFNTVWYELTPTVTGIATVRIADCDLLSVPFQVHLDVWTGASLTTISNVPIAPGPAPLSNSFHWNITAGTTYYIRLDSRDALSPSPTFLLIWETDQLDWGVKAGTFTAGATRVFTGLLHTPVVVMVWASGAPPGNIHADALVGFGASDGSSQFAGGHSYLEYPDGYLLHGQQIEQQLFSTSAIIAVPLPAMGAGTYAEASLTGVNPDGSFDLSWSVDPGDGSMYGYLVAYGIDVQLGTMSFAAGGTSATPLATAFRTRALFGLSIADAPTLANGWCLHGWTEEIVNLGEGSYSEGVKTGVIWYGPDPFDGDFTVEPPDWLTIDLTTPTLYPFVGEKDFTISHVNAAYNVDFGYVALGGCGWHGWSPAFEGSPIFDSNEMYVRGLLSFGNNGSGIYNSPSVGAADRQNHQFTVNGWYEGELASHLVYSQTGCSAWNNRVWVNQANETTATGYWQLDVPGNTGTQFGISGPGILGLLGNFFPPPLELIGPVSFSHITTGQKRVGIRVR